MGLRPTLNQAELNLSCAEWSNFSSCLNQHVSLGNLQQLFLWSLHSGTLSEWLFLLCFIKSVLVWKVFPQIPQLYCLRVCVEEVLPSHELCMYQHTLAGKSHFPFMKNVQVLINSGCLFFLWLIKSPLLAFLLAHMLQEYGWRTDSSDSSASSWSCAYP